MKITVPATSANMGPGFDTLGIAVSLYNESLITRSKFTSISIRGSGEGVKKLKKDNLFVRIFNEVYESITGKPDNFRFQFNNNIPISRGLGSSSAVIVGAITAAFSMAEKTIDKQEVLNKAFKYEMHPDNITPAVMGGFTTSLENNGRVLYKKVPIGTEIEAVVVIPDNPISTRRSRAVLPRRYPLQDAVFNIARTSMMTAAFLTKDWALLKEVGHDRLHQHFRMKTFPELFEVKKHAINNGALMSTLSGSGSTFFNIAYKDDALALANALSERFPHFAVKILGFDNDGIKVE